MQRLYDLPARESEHGGDDQLTRLEDDGEDVDTHCNRVDHVQSTLGDLHFRMMKTTDCSDLPRHEFKVNKDALLT